jgi:phytoene synthase
MLAPSRILRPPARQAGGGRWRDDLVAEARRSLRRGSRSLAFSARLLDKPSRERAWLLGAWCRRCGEIADGAPQAHAAGTPEAERAFNAIRVLTRRALEGEPTAEPAFDAFGQVALEAGLDEQLADDVIEGYALDAAGWQPHSEADLMRYCYHAAGAVAVMIARTIGVPADDDEGLDRACDLGIAFELIEIARDLGQDDAAGHCFIPAEWLAEADIPPGEHLRPAYRQQLAVVAARMLEMAAMHEATGRLGLDGLSFRQRWAAMTAANLYLAIADKVRRRGARAWDRRARANLLDKLRAGTKAVFEAMDHPPEPFARPEWDRGRILIGVRMAGPIPPPPMTPLPDEVAG